MSGVVARERDGSERKLRARLVVGADGRDSSVARLAGQKTKVKPNNRFCFMAYYRDTPLVTGPSSQTWFGNPDMTYAFPTDDGLTLLVCVPHKDRLAEFKAVPEAAMARAYSRLPEAPRVDPAKRVGKVLGKLDAPNEIRDPVGRGVALIGDAAVSADPVWGVGCGWAMQSGEWLAEEAGPALRDRAGLDRALAEIRAPAPQGRQRPQPDLHHLLARPPPRPARKARLQGRREGRRPRRPSGDVRRALDRAPPAAHPGDCRPDNPGHLSPGARPTGLRRPSPATVNPPSAL